MSTTEIDKLLAEDRAEIARIFEALERWQSLPWAEVQTMAKTVGPLILSQFVGRGIWDGLTAAEQAAVHWTMAEGHAVSGVSEAWVRPDRVGPILASLAHAADLCAVRCGEYQGHRSIDEPSSSWSEEHLARLDALPAGWRAEAIRRAAMSGDIVDAIGAASVTLNRLKSQYGIDPRTT